MLCSDKCLVHELIFCVSNKIVPTTFIISHFLAFNLSIDGHEKFLFTQTQSEHINRVSLGPTEDKARV